MASTKPLSSLALVSLLLLLLSDAANAFKDIGICYGTLGDNLPAARDVVGLYTRYGVGKMRLFNPNAAALEAVKGSGIGVTVGIKNEDIQGLAAGGREKVEEWFAANLGPYVNDVAFEYVAVGNEVIPGELGRFVLPVMQTLQAVFNEKSLGIKVTTVVPMNALAVSYPPSAGQFSNAAAADLSGILGFLGSQGVPLMINVYPYFAYASDPANVRLDYAQFTAAGTVVQDGSLSYSNLYDAMIDAFVSAMEKLAAGNVPIVVSETGWPSAGNGELTSPELAGTYNRNLIQHALAGVGTPKRPGTRIRAFVFAMFNEDQKPDGVEKNFGLFYPSMEPVYPVF